LRSCTPLVVLLLLLAGGAGAQMSPMGAVPAPPDTAVAHFSWRDDGPEPRGLIVFPGQTQLGDVVVLVLDLPADGLPVVADSLQVDVDWLEPAPAVQIELPEDFPAPRGAWFLAPFRIYRLGPWRPAWGDDPPGPLLAVTGRLEGAGDLAPIRDPRALGGLPLWVLVLAIGLALLAGLLLLVRRWRGRDRVAGAADRPLPPPAWMPAAVALWSLEQTPGHDRAFLDSLAAILRRYLGGRYHLPAQEMTAGEISAAALRAGWPAVRLRSFAKLLATCDEARYAPAAVGGQRCRQDMQLVIDLIDDERVEPVWSPVSASARTDAAAAWQELRQRYPDAEAGRSAC